MYHVFSKICAWNRFEDSIHLANVVGNAHANTAWRSEYLVLHALHVPVGAADLPPPTFEYWTQNEYNSLVWVRSNMALEDTSII